MLCAPSAKAATRSFSRGSGDAYASEILSLLLDLCRTEPGRLHLAKQDDLLIHLLSMLHTGCARIQRDAITMLRHLFPLVDPSHLAALLAVKAPPLGADGAIVESRRGSCPDFDLHEDALLDILFSCVAKALNVQTKVKGISSATCSSVIHSASSSITSSPYHGPAAGNAKSMATVTLATSIHPKDDLRNRWFMKGCMSRATAELLISLLKDMTAGRMGEKWSVVAGECVMQNILNLTRLREEFRCPVECMRTPTLWLALASLCVMDEDQAARLSNCIPAPAASLSSDGSVIPHSSSNHRVSLQLCYPNWN